MTLKDIVERMRLSVLTSDVIGDLQVSGGYTGDLLSDVMANGSAGTLWITMQTHKNIVAVARIKDLAGIIVVNGRRPDDETLRKADEEKVAILGTDDPSFRFSGRLFQLLEEQ